MPSEFDLDLCFVRPNGDAEAFYSEIEREMERLYGGGKARWESARRCVDGHDVAVVEANGLTHLDTEEAFVARLESAADSPCWDWLSGYRIVLTPKRDAGCCAWKRPRAEARAAT